MLNFDWLSDLSMVAAKAVIIGLFISIGWVVFRLRRPEARAAATRKARWWDLKVWTYALLILITAIYLYL